MSKNRTVVKGIGLFYLLFGIVSIAVAAMMFLGAAHVELNIEDGTQIAQMFGVILAVIGVFMLVAGVIGMRAAKHDGLLKPFVFISAFLVVVNLAEIGLIIRSGEGGEIYMNLICAAVSFTAVVFASRAMKESGLE